MCRRRHHYRGSCGCTWCAHIASTRPAVHAARHSLLASPALGPSIQGRSQSRHTPATDLVHCPSSQVVWGSVGGGAGAPEWALTGGFVTTRVLQNVRAERPMLRVDFFAFSVRSVRCECVYVTPPTIKTTHICVDLLGARFSNHRRTPYPSLALLCARFASSCPKRGTGKRKEKNVCAGLACSHSLN